MHHKDSGGYLPLLSRGAIWTDPHTLHCISPVHSSIRFITSFAIFLPVLYIFSPSITISLVVWQPKYVQRCLYSSSCGRSLSWGYVLCGNPFAAPRSRSIRENAFAPALCHGVCMRHVLLLTSLSFLDSLKSGFSSCNHPAPAYYIDWCMGETGTVSSFIEPARCISYPGKGNLPTRKTGIY